MRPMVVRRRVRLVGVILLGGLAVMCAAAAAAGHVGLAADDASASASAEQDLAARGFSAGVVGATWFATTSGTGEYYDIANDAVATSPRTVYVVGSLGHKTGSDIANLSLAKYVDGSRAWLKQYDGPAHHADHGAAIAARGKAIYTAGSTMTKSRGWDLVLIRWNSGGKRVWRRTYHRNDDHAVDVAVDRRGNVTVAGYTTRMGHDELFLVSYRPNGTRRYVRRYSGPLHLDEKPARMLIDSSGSVYVVGRSSSAAHGPDALVLKYSAAGRRLWVRRFNGTANNDDRAESLRARPGGGVYVAGTTYGAATGSDGLLLAYNAGGKRLFTVVDTGLAPNSNQGFFDLEVLPGGHIICGGFDTSAGNDMQQYLVRVDPAARAVESRSWRGGPDVDFVSCMAKDSQGGVYVSGPQFTVSGGSQVFTERICFRGANWASTWPPADPVGYDRPVAIAVGGVNVYVVGLHYDPVTLDDQVIVAYVY
jgi:hypothetical protein